MTQPLKINMSNTHSASHSAANFSRVQRYKEEQERKRKKYIKAVKTAQRQLCMDDATYRVMLEARTGQRSATDCTLAQLGAVLDHLRRAGATHPNAGSKRRLVPTADKASMMQKVWALLGELERVLALHGRGGRERGGQWSARGRAELEQVQDAPGGGRVEAVVGLGEALEPLERTGKGGRGLG
jgi:hypothetical protein